MIYHCLLLMLYIILWQPSTVKPTNLVCLAVLSVGCEILTQNSVERHETKMLYIFVLLFIVFFLQKYIFFKINMFTFSFSFSRTEFFARKEQILCLCLSLGELPWFLAPTGLSYVVLAVSIFQNLRVC